MLEIIDETTASDVIAMKELSPVVCPRLAESRHGKRYAGSGPPRRMKATGGPISISLR
jgi:hypothetical protein